MLGDVVKLRPLSHYDSARYYSSLDVVTPWQLEPVLEYIICCVGPAVQDLQFLAIRQSGLQQIAQTWCMVQAFAERSLQKAQQ